MILARVVHIAQHSTLLENLEAIACILSFQETRALPWNMHEPVGEQWLSRQPTNQYRSKLSKLMENQMERATHKWYDAMNYNHVKMARKN